MWKCNNCNEESEDNFNVCWNCGNDMREDLIPDTEKGNQVSFNETLEDFDKEKSFELDVVIKSLEASVRKRFFNNLIDSGLIISLTILLIILTGNEMIYLLMPFLFFLYYLIFESVSGATLGKIITGTRVVNCLGEKPHFLTIFARTFYRFIPFDAFTFATPGGGWHDNFSHTFVISIKP